jgi:Tc toxin complex TcA C-terminal TcB-binding domain
MIGYHLYTDLHFVDPRRVTLTEQEPHGAEVENRSVSYRFSNHFHPYAGDLGTRLVVAGTRQLEAADTARADGGQTLADPTEALLYEGAFFQDVYEPTPAVDLDRIPVKDLDFSSSGAYSVYNWELFFHVPLTIAIHLSRDQRFQEAQRWFHLIFDPTDDSDDPTPQRFWKVKPLQVAEIEQIEQILVNLATREDPTLLKETINAIHEWEDRPFRPHVVARRRHSAYMYKTVMSYLDNLIAWGDELFRQDTRETINEATQLYVLAANLLGHHPQEVPQREEIRPRSYADLRPDLREFGTVLQELETTLPFDTYPPPSTADAAVEMTAVSSIGKSLHFCVPRNDTLLEYWDTVADRLFKIRNSLNIRGIFRQLPLFEPAIDPALLARAAAVGLDVSAVIAGLNQPLPLVRFRFLIAKATELANEVKALGSSLLSAIEKEDAEALAILRAGHERAILDLSESVRYSQWQEAIKTREGLERSLEIVIRRYVFYERLLGADPNEIELPQMDDLDVQQLLDGRLRSSEPEVSPRDIDVDIASAPMITDLADLLSLAGGLHMNQAEAWALRIRTLAEIPLIGATVLELLASSVIVLPDGTIAGHPMGVGVDIEVPGGKKIAFGMESAVSAVRAIGDAANRQAGRMETAGSFARREQEWNFQSTLAAGELGQTLKQLRAAQIHEFIAKREYEVHQKQMAQAGEIETFLTDERKGKTTNREFYSWIRRELQALHSECFQLAFDVGKKAERALQYELGDASLTYLKYDYPAGKQGLLAGEKLQLDLKRMEIEYDDRNRREYELTRHVSLLQLDPYALLQLRMTGRCTVSLPEELFDLDGPGHYFRRIKWFEITAPAITGPYVNDNFAIRLQRSTIRLNPQLANGAYARIDADDSRFSDYLGSMEAIVSSSGQADSGMFSTNLNDDRYLPFEGSGVISEWQIELPANPSRQQPAQFDYQTIADVILHIHYTAREGGSQLRGAALDNLTARIDRAETIGSVRMFSIRHEFPSEWARFTSAKIDGANQRVPLALELKPEHYPFWSQGRLGELKSVSVVAQTARSSLEIGNGPDPSSPSYQRDTLAQDEGLGNLCVTEVRHIPLPTPIGEFTLYFDDNALKDLWLVVSWGTRP